MGLNTALDPHSGGRHRIFCRCWQVAKPLGGDIERTVEFAGHVLKGNQPRKFNHVILTELSAEAIREGIIHLAIGVGDRFCVFEGHPL